ncbi:uncharacterized protein LOC131849510 [Achroia grisella]|uniref:uncharacterized protein LOC131849510 n=1 Tax=Achroia grisella TaxID=688607 RepID=UPI0027D235CB|nr:uncharacterized protein LOC131849510 [Achroia grisella]
MIMKKNKQINGSTKRRQEKIEVKETNSGDNRLEKFDVLDDEEQGFSGWLRSADGLETMKLFVVANSIVMITTLALPHVQTVFQIISEMFYVPEGLHIEYE